MLGVAQLLRDRGGIRALGVDTLAVGSVGYPALLCSAQIRLYNCIFYYPALGGGLRPPDTSFFYFLMLQQQVQPEVPNNPNTPPRTSRSLPHPWAAPKGCFFVFFFFPSLLLRGLISDLMKTFVIDNQMLICRKGQCLIC